MKKVITFLVLFITAFTGIIVYGMQSSNLSKVDIVAVNDISQTLAERWDNIEQNALPCLKYGLDYCVVDNDGNLVATTKPGLDADVTHAIINRNTVVDIQKDDKVLGKLIIYNNVETEFEKEKKSFAWLMEIILILAALVCLLYALVIGRRILRPFYKLKDFAKHVAEGNLDIPLAMDKKNVFGVFTESFDLMRSELKKARENERKANQSKKELVASLSHDIKTPVASIKAVSEIMYVKTKNENEREQLSIISDKADQINTLIMNLFNATLEELQELGVTVTEQSSQKIHELIKKSDYNGRATIHGIAQCIIIADVLRLSQVIDNVIYNSYKYADTEIDVTSCICGEYLEITFHDYGKGVLEEELPLLFNKFFRAANSEGKSGAGLGLYISKFLMNKMSGDIECDNTDNGFIVKLTLLLA